MSVCASQPRLHIVQPCAHQHAQTNVYHQLMSMFSFLWYLCVDTCTRVCCLFVGFVRAPCSCCSATQNNTNTRRRGSSAITTYMALAIIILLIIELSSQQPKSFHPSIDNGSAHNSTLSSFVAPSASTILSHTHLPSYMHSPLPFVSLIVSSFHVCSFGRVSLVVPRVLSVLCVCSVACAASPAHAHANANAHANAKQRGRGDNNNNRKQHKKSNKATSNTAKADRDDFPDDEYTADPPLTSMPIPPPLSLNASLFHSRAPPSSSILLVSLSLRGHLVPILRLADSLLSVGHRVSVAVPDEGRELANHTRARIVTLGKLPYAKAERREKFKAICHDNSNFRGLLSLINDIYLPNNVPLYKALHPIVSKDRPDLMVIDIAALGAFDIAATFNIPFIINNPSLHYRSSPAPSTLPAWCSGFTLHSSVWERAVSYLYPRLLAVALTPSFMEINRLRWQRNIDILPSPQHIFNQAPLKSSYHLTSVSTSPSSVSPSTDTSSTPTSMTVPAPILVNTCFGIEYPYHLPPHVHMTGPYLPSSTSSSSSSTLSPSLSVWLDKTTKPVILVLFGAGSMSYLDASQVQQLSTGLTDTRFRVLWALRTDAKSVLGNVPASFRIKNNFPQLAALQHSAVRLVISPCGMATAQESLYYAKPLLCIPLFGDQYDVSVRVSSYGAGVMLDKSRLDAVELARIVTNMHRNVTYKQAAKRISAILRQQGGTRAATHIIQQHLNAIHHTNQTNIFTQYLHYNMQAQLWYERHDLDVLCVVVCIFLAVLLSLRVFVLLLYTCIARFHVVSSITTLIARLPHPLANAAHFIIQCIIPNWNQHNNNNQSSNNQHKHGVSNGYAEHSTSHSSAVGVNSSISSSSVESSSTVTSSRFQSVPLNDENDEDDEDDNPTDEQDADNE